MNNCWCRKGRMFCFWFSKPPECSNTNIISIQSLLALWCSVIQMCSSCCMENVEILTLILPQNCTWKFSSL